MKHRSSDTMAVVELVAVGLALGVAFIVGAVGSLGEAPEANPPSRTPAVVDDAHDATESMTSETTAATTRDPADASSEAQAPERPTAAALPKVPSDEAPWSEHSPAPTFAPPTAPITWEDVAAHETIQRSLATLIFSFWMRAPERDAAFRELLGPCRIINFAHMRCLRGRAVWVVTEQDGKGLLQVIELSHADYRARVIATTPLSPEHILTCLAQERLGSVLLWDARARVLRRAYMYADGRPMELPYDVVSAPVPAGPPWPADELGMARHRTTIALRAGGDTWRLIFTTDRARLSLQGPSRFLTQFGPHGPAPWGGVDEGSTALQFPKTSLRLEIRVWRAAEPKAPPIIYRLARSRSEDYAITVSTTLEHALMVGDRVQTIAFARAPGDHKTAVPIEGPALTVRRAHLEVTWVRRSERRTGERLLEIRGHGLAPGTVIQWVDAMGQPLGSEAKLRAGRGGHLVHVPRQIPGDRWGIVSIRHPALGGPSHQVDLDAAAFNERGVAWLK